MPRALTEKEKCAQCQKLLEKGKDVVLAYGIRKVSVDDVAKAAGLAKGTFYQHFASKEQYLYALIEKIHHETFSQAEKAVLVGLSKNGGDMRANVRGFLQKLFYMPEMVFFLENESDINTLFETVPNQELQSFKQIEEGLFEGILRLAGIDAQKVKPGVVHNYIHALFLVKGSPYMMEDDLQETLDLMMDGLFSYIFGGAL